MLRLDAGNLGCGVRLTGDAGPSPAGYRSGDVCVVFNSGEVCARGGGFKTLDEQFRPGDTVAVRLDRDEGCWYFFKHGSRVVGGQAFTGLGGGAFLVWFLGPDAAFEVLDVRVDTAGATRGVPHVAEVSLMRAGVCAKGDTCGRGAPWRWGAGGLWGRYGGAAAGRRHAWPRAARAAGRRGRARVEQCGARVGARRRA